MQKIQFQIINSNLSIFLQHLEIRKINNILIYINKMKSSILI